MSNFVNLLDIMYPVNSVYLSVSSISPASLIGGTWEQISGAVLAATGANNFAKADTYGGNLAISNDQAPKHSHYCGWQTTNKVYYDGSYDYGASYWDSNVGAGSDWGIWSIGGSSGGLGWMATDIQGGRASCHITSRFTYGSALPRFERDAA